LENIYQLLPHWNFTRTLKFLIWY
jgi:Fic family protein